jgi:hypothetical protein
LPEFIAAGRDLWRYGRVTWQRTTGKWAKPEKIATKQGQSSTERLLSFQFY